MNVPYEHVTWVYGPLAVVAVTFWPASIITAILHILVRALSIVPRAAAELARVIVAVALWSVGVPRIVHVVVRPMMMTIAESTLPSRLVPFIITTIAVTITIAVPNVVVPLSRVAPSRVVKHRHLR
jgi:hypothetical protein